MANNGSITLSDVEDVESARRDKVKMIKRFWREARESGRFLIRAGCIEKRKPPRKTPISMVHKMIEYCGTPGFEWRHTPSLGNDPILPSEQRDVAAPAYNTRSRQCCCEVVRNDCNYTIKELRRLTDEILDHDILCGGGIRKILQDAHLFLQSIQDHIHQNLKSPDFLPDQDAHAEWSLATNKACKALVHPHPKKCYR